MLTEPTARKFVTDEEIDNITAHHPPKSEEVIQAHERVRQEVNQLMKFFNELLPEGPMKTVLLRHKCREVMMYANAIVACEGIISKEQ